jgi:hypothetical protein
MEDKIKDNDSEADLIDAFSVFDKGMFPTQPLHRKINKSCFVRAELTVSSSSNI